MKVIINNNISKNTITLICILGIIVSFVMFYGSIKPFVDIEILKIATKTEAIITANTNIGGTVDIERSYAVKFDYVVNENILNGMDSIYWTSLKYNEGDKIDVYYNNNKPSNVQIYHISYVALGFSLLLLVGIILIMNKNFQRRK